MSDAMYDKRNARCIHLAECLAHRRRRFRGTSRDDLIEGNRRKESVSPLEVLHVGSVDTMAGIAFDATHHAYGREDRAPRHLPLGVLS